MRKYIRAIFDEIQGKSRRRVAAEQNSAVRAGRGREVGGALFDELVREDREGDGLFGAGVDSEVGGSSQVESGKKIA